MKKILILSFSPNRVNEKSFIPNKLGLTFACVEECQKQLEMMGYESEHICINKKNINKCAACGERGWGICLKEHKCILKDDFNDIYQSMEGYDAYVFVTPVYFWEMSESAKVFFDRLKRCDAFYKESKIKGKKMVCIACAGGSGTGTEETLQSFDILNSFLKMQMCGRIPMTKESFVQQKGLIQRAMELL